MAFISGVTFRTIDLPIRKAASLILFPDIAAACQAVLILRHCQGVLSAEFMDRGALRTVQDYDGLPVYIKDMGETVAALLVETGASDLSSLKRNISEIQEKLKSVKLAHEYAFTSDQAETEALWKVRKGIFPCACSERDAGTAVIIEDIAVPVENLHDCLLDLQLLFAKYGYKNCVIWGHVLDGNIHFVLTPDFSMEEEVRRYKKFMFEMTDLIVDKFNGSLKAEHGTGRNMAPFVEKEWGSEIYAVMREIKKIFDPGNLFNPGVLISDDMDIFVKNFKPMPTSHQRIDACIECGFCEKYCMSNGFTLSPRQRIIIWREIQRLKHARGGLVGKKVKVLEDMFNYQGDKTCAVDSLCSIGCPLNIDVGAFIKDLRNQWRGTFSNFVAARIGRNMAIITPAARLSLKLVNRLHGILGTKRMTSFALSCRKFSGNRLPLWNASMPTGAEKGRYDPFCHESIDCVVYFPSCLSRTMGPARDYDTFPSLPQTTENLLRKAGYQVIYPQNLHNLCCGLAFASKGFKSMAREKEKELEKALKSASRNSQIPILCDTSPCLNHMKANLDPSLKLYDPIEFTMAFLTKRLLFTQLPETIALHATCSVKKMALESQLVTLAKMCAEKIIFPDMICCGFAGDKGFTQPELNAFGLRNLKKEIPKEVTSGYSSSRTCEIGLSLHGGIPYKSILYLVDRATQVKV